MGITHTTCNQCPASRNARLRALAAMLACVLALAAVALSPLNAEKAYAEGGLNIPGPVIITAPAGVEGDLLPVYLKELANFPNEHVNFRITDKDLKNGIEDAEMDDATGTLKLKAGPGGGKVSYTDFDTIRVQLYNMSSDNLADLEIRVYFVPVLDNFTVETVNGGTYDPLNPHTKFFGYEGTGTGLGLVDGIEAIYFEGAKEKPWEDYDDIPSNDNKLILRKGGWQYLYRNAEGGSINGVPSIQTFNKRGERANVQDGGIEAPTNAGTYQLIIAAGYVQQQNEDGTHPSIRLAAGWKTINFTVAKAAAFEHEYLAEDTLDVKNGDSNINLRTKLDTKTGKTLVPADCMANANDHPTYTVTSTDYVGLRDVTITPEGMLTIFTNGMANSKADAPITDTVTVSVTNMDNYENSTITIPVTYEEKPTATFDEPMPAAETGLVYDGTPKKGYTGEAKLTWKGDDGKDSKLTLDTPSYNGVNGTTYGPTTTQPTDAGNYTVTFSVPVDEKCQADPLVLEFEIAKAAAPALTHPEVKLFEASNYSTSFSPLTEGVPNDAGGTPAYEVKSFTKEGLESAAIDPASGKLTLVTNGEASTRIDDTVTVSLTGMGNYHDAEFDIRVTYAERPVATISGAQAANSIYDGTPHKGYTGAPHADYPDQTQTYTGPFVETYTGTAFDGTEHDPALGAPIAAGNYTATFSLPANVPLVAEKPLALDFTIAKAKANLAYPRIELLDADGYSASFNPLDGILANAGGNPTYAASAVTQNGTKSVSINEKGTLSLVANGKAGGLADKVAVKLTGMNNYEDAYHEVDVHFADKPVASIEGVQAADGTYDGTPKAGYTGTPSVTYLPYGKAEGEEETYTGPFDISYVGTNGTVYGPAAQEPTAAGNYQVTFSLPESVPCIASPVAHGFTIAKAPLPLMEHSLEMLDEAGYTDSLDLLADIPANDGGKPVFQVKDEPYNGLQSASIENGQLALVANGKSGTRPDTVTVNITGLLNHQDGVATVAVAYAPKPAASIEGVQAVTGLVYNGTPQKGYTGTPSVTYLPYRGDMQETYTGPLVVSYSGTVADGTAYGPNAQAPTAAGTYTVTFSLPENAPCAGLLEVDFAIAQAPLTFQAVDASMTAGGSVPTLDYTVQGLVGTDRVVQNPALTVEGDTSKAGYCTIAVTGGIVDNQASYLVDYKPGTLTVNAAPKKDEPKEDAGKQLASTGDPAPMGLLVVAAGASALALGFAASRAFKKRRG